MQGSNPEDSQFPSSTGVAIGNPSSLTVEQAIANLRGSDLGLRYYSAWWLGRFRVNLPEAVDVLIDSLFDESDRTSEGGYPLRRNAARALGKLGDVRAVPALLQNLRCSDFYVREACAQALGSLGDRSCIPALMQLLESEVEVDRSISDPAYLDQPYDAILEALGALGATEVIPLVEPFLDHPFPLLRYAAARVMYQLTQNAVYGDRLVAALSSEKLQLRRAILSDLGAIGYLPAAEPIAKTLAENSLKLIALKGLLEKQLQQTTPPDLSEGAIKVMTLMDELL